ncbi:glycosyltransferase family 4 protein [Desulforhopalus singaporensis]|uniref:Glycosyltransferase involved in cell wall bisynthesis n=1 Tax=Desulforhopalus singaporensis TaxID=91360 RepID=A0A1H0QX67_9BACT|nr:glycosyltransferase family 4 protein [Desulforhopalus singaporensis]SDP21328.1 Glycosyltransferase involved in cell wall bisynthesis [Desulforhopalus singaporensis]
MKIAYYMPFKPLGHPVPSGDLVIGTELHDNLKSRGHHVLLVSRIRCRWIYYRPLAMLKLIREKRRITSRSTSPSFDIWLSYHSYYKCPDLLGLACSRKLDIPYVIFQGIYSTKRRKKLATLPGYLLNRRVLLGADHIFTNKHRDYRNLARLLPKERLTYIAPGIRPQQFEFSKEWHRTSRQQWKTGDETIIMTAAMMRPGVKTEGLETVIRSASLLAKRGHNLKLIVVGDGQSRPSLERLANSLLGERCIFCGKIERNRLYRYYSGADFFAFPGVEESLGMVYLEAQSCGLPVVAFREWGGGEAVVDGHTGLLATASRPDTFTDKMEQLILQPELRAKLGANGAVHIRSAHDIDQNYKKIETTLRTITGLQDP